MTIRDYNTSDLKKTLALPGDPPAPRSIATSGSMSTATGRSESRVPIEDQWVLREAAADSLRRGLRRRETLQAPIARGKHRAHLAAQQIA